MASNTDQQRTVHWVGLHWVATLCIAFDCIRLYWIAQCTIHLDNPAVGYG